MTDRDQIFSGVKEVDEKLQIDKNSLNDFLKNLLGNKLMIVCKSCLIIFAKTFLTKIDVC